MIASRENRLIHKEANGHLGCDRETEEREYTAYIAHNDNKHSSNTIFEMVKEDSLDGGPIMWSDRVRLRHVGSDAALTVRGAASTKMMPRARSARRTLSLPRTPSTTIGEADDVTEVVLTADLSSHDTLFELIPQYPVETNHVNGALSPLGGTWPALLTP